MDAVKEKNTSDNWPLRRIGFGGDYNPEQWPREVWDEDIRLMREAGVSIVTVGVFAWGMIEPQDGEYEWEWLDDIIGRLHDAGIAVDLATPTAAPPNWLLAAHPEILPTNQFMEKEHPGGRLGWCPSSEVFRGYAVRIASALAERYGNHPAVVMWHVSNELGGGNARCYCDESATRFRGWLRRRYGHISALNDAWGTPFWGHVMTDFEQVLPPRGGNPSANPALMLDFERFSSDELLEHFRAEKVAIVAHSSVPVTTNLMVSAAGAVADYATWVADLDLLANDHYTIVTDRKRHIELALSADRMRGLAGGGPWMMMEHSTGAPSWQQRNRAKTPREILRNSLSHVARGSESAMFFQWRASTAGAEQFHSAMVPHAGANSRVFREVVELGRILATCDEIVGSTVPQARVAMLSDVESAWVLEYGLKPHRALRYSREQLAWYSAFWRRGIAVDVIPADADLAGYDLVLVPTVFVGSQRRTDAIAAHLDAGGAVVVTYQSGIVDPSNRVIAGGYPGTYRELLGVRVEEFRPLQDDEQVVLSDGAIVTDWVEDIEIIDADTVLSIVQGPRVGMPAVTRRRLGRGAWYVGAMLPDHAVQRLVDWISSELSLSPVIRAPEGVEAVRRVRDDRSWLFLINHTDDDVSIDGVEGTDLVSGQRCTSGLSIEAGAVAVVAEKGVR